MEKTHTVSVGEVVFSNTSRLNIIAGPCVMESLGHALDIAGKLCELSQELDIPFLKSDTINIIEYTDDVEIYKKKKKKYKFFDLIKNK